MVKNDSSKSLLKMQSSHSLRARASQTNLVNDHRERMGLGDYARGGNVSAHALAQAHVDAMYDNLSTYRSQVQQAKSSINNLERMQAESLAHTEALSREATNYPFACKAPSARFSQAPTGNLSFQSDHPSDDYPMVYKCAEEQPTKNRMLPYDDYYEAVRRVERLSAENDRLATSGRSYTESPAPKTADGRSLFEKYTEAYAKDVLIPGMGRQGLLSSSLLAESAKKAERVEVNKLKAPEEYTQPFLDFMTENPTVFHAVVYFEEKLADAGFKKLSERKTWNDELVKGGKYFINRNGSSLIAFTIGDAYKSGNGVAMVAGHVDALTARLKPVSTKKTTAGYVQLGVAPYAGGLNTTWWDRDLGIGGRVVVKDSKSGKITTRLVKLGWPIARIPTLAPHFGVGMFGKGNLETEVVPIIGLDNSDISSTASELGHLTLGDVGSFAATQPPKLVRAIAGELSITEYSEILNWELELYDTQPAQTGGLDKEFIFAGRIDDKVCSWAAVEGLLAASVAAPKDDGIIKLVGVFDDEEIGSLLRQGARGNFLPSVIERITETFAPSGTISGANLLSQTYANSFLISADVTHAVNPNFMGSYLENHTARLNVGLAVCADSNGHMTTDSISTSILTRCAEKSGNKLQVFMIRNDSRSGGTVGPMLSAAMGVRAIDAGIPQLSMHSIRATIGNLDPGLGAAAFAGFFNEFESVDKEFE